MSPSSALPPATAALHRWFAVHARPLPWRVYPPNPYHIWLSEVMGQQTTLAAVIPYFQRFIALWPHLSDLAAAPEEAILAQWAGLGYYARARNLHRCAQTVMRDYNGVFPADEASLRRLPGLGAYAAAAIAAIAFDQPAVVVDGNVARVISRLYALDAPIARNGTRIRELAATLTPDSAPRTHAEAMMDLGATLCTPRNPACVCCPVMEFCLARQQGRTDELPTKAAKAARPDRYGVVFWLQRPDGAVLTRQRPKHGLLGGMTEFPSTPWQDGEAWAWSEALAHAPVMTEWSLLPEPVVHVFSHFRLFLTVAVGKGDIPAPDGQWLLPTALAHAALPSLMVKVKDRVEQGSAP